MFRTQYAKFISYYIKIKYVYKEAIKAVIVNIN